MIISKVGSKDTENMCLDTGHIGIYVSSKCQKEFAPKIAKWLKDRDEEPKKRPVRKRSKGKASTKKKRGKVKASL
jgi:polyhydroxyalkanoate synthase